MAQQVKRNIDPGALTQVARTFQLVWRLLADARVPVLPKLIIPLVIVYVVSPIDLIPDVMPIVGQMDDLAVIFMGIRFFIELCPADIVMEHRRAIAGSAGEAHDEYVDGTYHVVDDDKNK